MVMLKVAATRMMTTLTVTTTKKRRRRRKRNLMLILSMTRLMKRTLRRSLVHVSTSQKSPALTFLP
jgi:hypothetical protein